MRNIDDAGRISAMKSTTSSPVGVDRRVPGWASGVIAGLARDLPAVVTREDAAERMAEAGLNRDVDAVVSELRRLGWLVGLPVQGAWAFIPPGQDAVADPYLPLRAWRARHPSADFLLAGEAAGWHLGYLDRRPDGPMPIWKRADLRLPDGLRPYVTVVQLKWGDTSTKELQPSAALLARRHLDIVNWAGGLPAFGPEALLVQLAARPASFQPWADLVTHLGQMIADCDDDRLARFLSERTASTWQRAAYLLHAGGAPSRGLKLLDRKPPGAMPTIRFEHPDVRRDPSRSVWVPQYRLVDRLVAPLRGIVGKG